MVTLPDNSPPLYSWPGEDITKERILFTLRLELHWAARHWDRHFPLFAKLLTLVQLVQVKQSSSRDVSEKLILCSRY